MKTKSKTEIFKMNNCHTKVHVNVIKFTHMKSYFPHKTVPEKMEKDRVSLESMIFDKMFLLLHFQLLGII